MLRPDRAEDAEGAEDAEAERTEAERAEVETAAMLIDEVTYKVIGAAMTVHSALGPGLLEKAYDSCMRDELRKANLQFTHQVNIPVSYQGITLPAGFKVDYLVEGCVVVELKAVDKLLPVFLAQLRSYLKLSGHTLGLLINFHVVHLRNGIHRVVNGYDPNQHVPGR